MKKPTQNTKLSLCASHEEWEQYIEYLKFSRRYNSVVEQSNPKPYIVASRNEEEFPLQIPDDFFMKKSV